MRTVISVTVEVDKLWPSDKEVENRNQVIQDLADRNVGKFLWAGSETGKMDFAMEVHDDQGASQVIRELMSQHLPGWKYSLESVPARLAPTFRLHTKHGRHAGNPVQKQEPGLGMGM